MKETTGWRGWKVSREERALVMARGSWEGCEWFGRKAIKLKGRDGRDVMRDGGLERGDNVTLGEAALCVDGCRSQLVWFFLYFLVGLMDAGVMIRMATF